MREFLLSLKYMNTVHVLSTIKPSCLEAQTRVSRPNEYHSNRALAMDCPGQGSGNHACSRGHTLFRILPRRRLLTTLGL